MAFTLKEILMACDATDLKAVSSDVDIIALCDAAKKYKCAAVCVNSAFVPWLASELAGSAVKTCTVVGFPLGAMSSAAKAEETRIAVENGAEEIDMGIEVGKLRAGDTNYVLQDISNVVEAAQGRTVKVIIETCYLTDDQKITACELAKIAGAQFVKTSTGFGTGGATVSDVALMYHTVAPQLQVKASGGVRTARDAAAMMEAGASRLGTGNIQSIIDGIDDYQLN